jgi:TonB-linked SusC/RagA family outer membrane protein
MRIRLLVIFLLSSCVWSYAQNIRGRVTDEKKEAVVGATVTVDNTTLAAITDTLGFFSIKVPKEGKYTIRISYVGFNSLIKQVEASENPKVVSFMMYSDSKMLEDVVVVGYGTKLKREVTGSIAKINAKELNDMPAPSFDAALQAKLPGVQVTTGSGMAGSASMVRIRGVASISAGGDPLYVIDGIPITQDYFLTGNGGAMNSNPLASINPDDIESIEVLKDAAATAIYGSRGANGVIIITTKRAGNKKGLRFSYNGNVGISKPTALPNMLNNWQYLQLYQEAWENDGNTGLAKLPGNISWEDAVKTNTNWVDLTTQTGFKNSHNFTVSKGGEKFSILGNMSYADYESYLVGNKYNRLSGRINGDVRITKNLSASISTSISRGTNYRVNTAWAGGLGAAMSTALPIYPIYDSTGNYWTGGDNPVRIQNLKDWRTTETRSINGITFTYFATKNLTLSARGNLDYMQLLDDQYDPRALINTTHAGTANRNATWVTNYNYNFQANYRIPLSKISNMNIMAAHEYQNSLSTSKNIVGTNMKSGYWNENAAIKDSLFSENEFRQSPQQWAFMSYFSRVSYDYNKKYFLEATARVDGSSRFGTNYRYGFFPAFAASWIMSEESFLKSIRQISFTKFRASYGKSGNANIPNYQRFGIFQNPGSTPNYNGQPTTFPIQLENPNLRWETSWTLNLALEMGLFRDRITFVTEYYDKRTKDVLLSLAVPPSTGFTNYWDNVGAVRNRGVEFSLTTRNIVGKFTWTTNFNIARNINEITSIGVYTEDAVSGGTNDTRVVVGQPVGTNYLVRYSHIDPATGRPVYLDINGNPTFTWDPANRVAVGHVVPNAIGGIQNMFTYKNFDLSILFNFVLGGDIYESSAKRQLGVVTNWNMRTDLFDRWQYPGDNAQFPRLTLDTKTYGSSTPWINTTMWLHDGTFARLRNLTFGYTVPQKYLQKKKISSLRIAFVGTNLLTFTRYPGLDPEIARDFENTTDRNMSPNITYLTPPQEKTYNLNLSISF